MASPPDPPRPSSSPPAMGIFPPDTEGRRTVFTWATGGALVGLRRWTDDGIIRGVQGLVRGLDAQGRAVGDAVELPRIGLDQGLLDTIGPLDVPVLGVGTHPQVRFAREDAPSPGARQLVLGDRVRWVDDCWLISEEGETGRLGPAREWEDVVRAAPVGHVAVGLHGRVYDDRLSSLSLYFDRSSERQGTDVGTVRGPELAGRPAANRWWNEVARGLLADRAAGRTLRAWYPHSSRQVTPAEVNVVVPADCTSPRLYLKLQRSLDALGAVEVSCGARSLEVFPAIGGDASPLHRVDLGPLGAGQHTLVVRAVGSSSFAVLSWCELTDAGPDPA